MVQPGDTLLKISMRYKVRTQELAMVNNVFGDTIFHGQVSKCSLKDLPIKANKPSLRFDKIKVQYL